MTNEPTVPALLRAARAIERSVGLDGLVHRVRGVAERVVPAPGRVRAELHGRSLGHAAHSVLTDVPVGLWTSATVLDLTGGDAHGPAARRLVGLGVLSTVPVVATGLADYLAVDRPAARVGAVHAVLNGAVTVLYGTSWLLRRAGRQRGGVAVSLLGYGLAGVSAYLGGHIAQGLREPPADVALGGGWWRTDEGPHAGRGAGSDT